MDIVEAVPFLQKHPIYTAGDEDHPAPIHLNEFNDSKFIVLTGEEITLLEKAIFLKCYHLGWQNMRTRIQFYSL